MARPASESLIAAKNAAIDVLNKAGSDPKTRLDAIQGIDRDTLSSILRDMFQRDHIRLPDGAIPAVIRAHYGNTEAIKSIKADILRWIIASAKTTPKILNYTGAKLSLPLWYDPDHPEAANYAAMASWRPGAQTRRRKIAPSGASIAPIPSLPTEDIVEDNSDTGDVAEPTLPNSPVSETLSIPSDLLSWPLDSALPLARLTDSSTPEEIISAYEESANADPAPERPPIGLSTSPEIRQAYRLAAEECLKRVTQRQERLQRDIEAAMARADAIIAAYEVTTQHHLSHPLLVDRHDLGRIHPAAEEIIDALLLGINVMLVGPAATGKTHLCEVISRAMGRKFGVCSVTAGISVSNLTGYLIPTGDNMRFAYHPSPLVALTEEGNANFLFDEFDRGDPNTLTLINSLLANGYISLPHRLGAPMLYKAENVGYLAAANTYGGGMDYKYSGANQLDAATLDRFWPVYIDYDPVFESGLAGVALADDSARPTSARLKTQQTDAEIASDCANLYNWVIAVRRAIEELQMQRVLGRGLHNGVKMLKTGHYTLSHVKKTILSPWSDEERRQIQKGGLSL